MITVCCVWVKANVPYGVEYVTNLRAMVKKHLPREHRFVCLTDRPEQLPDDVDTVRIGLPSNVFGWWAKVNLFNTDNVSGRVLYLDLDTLVTASLEPIVDYPSWFALVPDGGSFQPKTAHKVVKRFNSSVMVWDTSNPAEAEALRWIYLRWTPLVARDFWGDQDWIGQYVNGDTMPASWFPRLSELNGRPPGPDAKVVLCKKPKNEIAARQYPWVADAWRAA